MNTTTISMPTSLALLLIFGVFVAGPFTEARGVQQESDQQARSAVPGGRSSDNEQVPETTTYRQYAVAIQLARTYGADNLETAIARNKRLSDLPDSQRTYDAVMTGARDYLVGQLTQIPTPTPIELSSQHTSAQAMVKHIVRTRRLRSEVQQDAELLGFDWPAIVKEAQASGNSPTAGGGKARPTNVGDRHDHSTATKPAEPTDAPLQIDPEQHLEVSFKEFALQLASHKIGIEENVTAAVTSASELSRTVDSLVVAGKLPKSSYGSTHPHWVWVVQIDSSPAMLASLTTLLDNGKAGGVPMSARPTIIRSIADALAPTRSTTQYPEDLALRFVKALKADEVVALSATRRDALRRAYSIDDPAWASSPGEQPRGVRPYAEQGNEVARGIQADELFNGPRNADVDPLRITTLKAWAQEEYVPHTVGLLRWVSMSDAGPELREAALQAVQTRVSMAMDPRNAAPEAMTEAARNDIAGLERMLKDDAQIDKALAARITDLLKSFEATKAEDQMQRSRLVHAIVAGDAKGSRHQLCLSLLHAAAGLPHSSEKDIENSAALADQWAKKLTPVGFDLVYCRPYLPNPASDTSLLVAWVVDRKPTAGEDEKSIYVIYTGDNSEAVSVDAFIQAVETQNALREKQGLPALKPSAIPPQTDSHNK